MPAHDWRRVRAGKFHHFHNSWIYKLSDRLNAGLLPPGFYAAGEQVVGEIEPDLLTLQRRTADAPFASEATGAVAVEQHPPRVSITVPAEEIEYLKKQDQLVIRGVDDDRLIALVEIVSRGNKSSRHELDRFLRKVAAALDCRVHLLIVDLQRPGALDPQGIHGAVWDYLLGTPFVLQAECPLTLVSYRATPLTAYVEPIAVAARLPDMPLFLDSAWYIDVPLEETYLQTWQGFPDPWKAEVLGTGMDGETTTHD